MNRDDTALLDIAQCARLIMEFQQGVDETVFMSDFKTQSAIMHQLMVMGEAVKRDSRLSCVRAIQGFRGALLQACATDLFMPMT